MVGWVDVRIKEVGWYCMVFVKLLKLKILGWLWGIVTFTIIKNLTIKNEILYISKLNYVYFKNTKKQLIVAVIICQISRIVHFLNFFRKKWNWRKIFRVRENHKAPSFRSGILKSDHYFRKKHHRLRECFKVFMALLILNRIAFRKRLIVDLIDRK